MARIKRTAPTPPASRRTEEPDDLAVLFPDVELEIGGENITVRELRFGEQLRYAPPLARVHEAVKGVFASPAMDVAEIIDALAACQDDIAALVLAATGKDRAWLDALSGAEGEALLAAFWSANRGFFLRRLLDYPAMRLAAATGVAGEPSSRPSSGTDIKT